MNVANMHLYVLNYNAKLRCNTHINHTYSHGVCSFGLLKPNLCGCVKVTKSLVFSTLFEYYLIA